MSIIAYPLEATEYTAEDVQSYLSTRTSGVYSEDITFTPEGMTVTVSPFLAWFNYAKFKGCSVAVTEPETLTFSPAHAVLDRIDRIALRVDFTLNRAYFTIIEGIPSSIPTAPEISKTEIINDISPVYVRIRAGATEITPADITSTILDESVCGIMRDGVTGIPTAQLQAQVEELILRLHEAIDGVESGSAFMMSDLYDPDNKAKPVAFADEAVPLDGSKAMTGLTLGINNGHGYIYNNIYQTRIQSRNESGSDDNSRALQVRNSAYPNDTLKGAVRLVDTTDGKTIAYCLYGEHNKPTGSYVGSGTNTTRTINIGGSGKILFVTGGVDFYIVTEYGVFRFTIGRQYYQTDYKQYANFTNGVLTVKNQYPSEGDAMLDEVGETYYYQVL